MTKSGNWPPKLQWNVFYEDVNSNKIREFNIFDHYSFYADCRKNAKDNHDDRKAFEERLGKNLAYYYWSKCEWEIVLNGWPQTRRTERKVDVYTQVRLNWRHFADYVWNNRNKLYRRRQRKC